MAVYTHLTYQEINDFIKNYRIGELVNFTEIISGIDNSNFIITTKNDNGKNQKFILTIFEGRINISDLPFFIDLKHHLAINNIKCPNPIANNQNLYISDLKAKKAIIVSFLDGTSLVANDQGYYNNINQQHCFSIGETLAKMHIAAMSYKNHRINDLAINDFNNILEKISPSLDQKQYQNLQENIKFLQTKWQLLSLDQIPIAACHLDLFPDNVFFNQEQEITGIIDFYFAANDLLIYDLAITINAWCFDECHFNYQKLQQLLLGYQKIRKLTTNEIKFFDTALATASMRFLLTRLHDKIFTKENSLVTIKDPKEYQKKLDFFLNNNIFNLKSGS